MKILRIGGFLQHPVPRPDSNPQKKKDNLARRIE